MKRANISSRGNCDFISSLPDPILQNILGLLTTKKAVQICVLSKRWEHLWSSLPSLNFNFPDFFDNPYNDFFDNSDDYSDYDSDDNYDYVKEMKARMESISANSVWFVNFVNAFLLRRKPLDLDVFHLYCYELKEDSVEMDWIRYAMNHNTRVLHLSPCNIIPWPTYTFTSLEKLYLYSPDKDSSVQKVNLPNLKKLKISYVNLDSNYVKNFLSGCPILEFLELDTCNFNDCIIAHEYLKYLVLVTRRIKEELFVSAPNLLSFSYEGELSLPSKTTLNMPSLASSRLTSCDPPYSFKKRKTICDPSMIKCLEGMATCIRFLTNVDFLELHFECSQHKELLASVLSLELPIFPNLKNVIVAFCMFSCFQMVSGILKNSPKLEKLTILQNGCLSHGEVGASTDHESTSISSTIAISPYKKLKIVEVKYYRYNQMVRQLVNTLKYDPKRLENLKIYRSKYKCSRQY